MKQLLLNVLVTAIVASAVSFVVVTTVKPAASSDEPRALETTRPVEAVPVDVEGLAELRQAVAFLEAELELLKRERKALDREAVVASAPSSDGEMTDAPLGKLDPQGEELLRAEVSKVVAQLEEAKEAEAREKELEERREEAIDANAEYDELDLELDQHVAKLGDRLNLGIADRRAMRDLLSLQNDRNREMTRLWSAGERSDEELGEMYESNRAAHRAEIYELVGADGIDRYRKFLQGGELGGRFSFFTTPWEEWDDVETD